MLAPTLVATVLLARHLGHQPLWFNEIATVSAARRSFADLYLLLRHTDAVLGPYYLLMHFWTALGTDPWWVRLPSLLGGVATVGLTAALGARLRGPLVGLVAGLLAATNPFLAYYAHDARPYTLVAAACALATLLLLPDPAAASGRRRWAWSLAAVTAVFLHLFSLLVVGVQAALLLTSRARRRWLAPVALVAVAAAPLAWVAMREQGELSWVRRTTGLTYLSAWSQLTGGHWLALLEAVPVIAAVVLFRRDRAVRALALWLVVPAFVLVTVSLVKPVFVPRYTLVSAPALALMAAVGLVELGRRASARVGARPMALVAAGTASLVLLAGGAVLAQQNRAYAYENMPAAADLVLDGARPGDAIAYLAGSARISLDYYLCRIDPKAPRPLDVLLATGSSPTADGTFGGQNVAPSTGLQRLLAHQRVWVVDWADTHGLLARQMLGALQGHYREVRHGQFGQAKVSLWSRLPA